MSNKDIKSIENLYSKILTEADSPENILAKGNEMVDAVSGSDDESTQQTTSQPASLVDKYAFEKLDREGKTRKLSEFGKGLSEQEREYKKRKHSIKGKKTGLSPWGQKLLRKSINSAWLTQEKTGKQQGVLIYGDTGIGKTTTVKDWCEKKAKQLGLDKSPTKFGQKPGYLDLNKLSESQIDEILQQDDVSEYFVLVNLNAKSFLPTDYEGVPILPKDINEHDGKIRDHLKALKLDFIRYLSRPGARGVLFLDELNHAQVDVMNYMFNVIEEHLFGRTKISDDVLVIAAGNLGVGHGNVQPLPTGLKARFYKKGFLILDPDDWYEFARSAKIDGRIINYIKTNPYRLLGQEAEIDKYGKPLPSSRQLTGEERRGMEAFPTPRGVENFAKQFDILREEFESAFIRGESEEERIAKGFRPKEELEEWYSEIEDAAKDALGDEWAEGFVRYLRIIDSFELGPLAREATSQIKSGSKMVRKFKSSDTDQARLYALADYLVTIIKPITDDMITNGKTDPTDGSLVPADPERLDALRLQAVMEVVNACKPEIQAQIFEEINALPKRNSLAFKYFVSKYKGLDPEIKREFLEDAAQMFKKLSS
jgi:hypothetical protein